MRKIETRLSFNPPLPGILAMSVNLLPAAAPVDGRRGGTRGQRHTESFGH